MGFSTGVGLLLESGHGGKAFFFAACFTQGQVPFAGELHTDTYVKQETAAGFDTAAVFTSGQQFRSVYQKRGQQYQEDFYEKGKIHSGLYICERFRIYSDVIKNAKCKIAELADFGAQSSVGQI